MANSQMVIVWPNSDGTITLSQRDATSHNMPTPLANPSQVANLALTNSIVRSPFPLPISIP